MWYEYFSSFSLFSILLLPCRSCRSEVELVGHSSTLIPCRFTLGPSRVWHALVNSFNIFVGMTLEVKDGDGHFFWKRQKVKKLGKEANATEEVGTTCLKWQKFFVNVLVLEQLLLPSPNRADACQKLQVQSECCKVPFLVQGCRG